MTTSTPDRPGFFDSLRSLGDGLLTSLRDRVELFSLELEEERTRLLRSFVWICAAMCTGVMTLVFGSLTLVYLFWDTARLAVLGGLTIAYGAALAAVIVYVRRTIARQPRPFAATLAEIDADRACMRD
jgi:uncharacterized membrane protein YqjE